jgi:hypothetical protein
MTKKIGIMEYWGLGGAKSITPELHQSSTPFANNRVSPIIRYFPCKIFNSKNKSPEELWNKH